MEGKKKLKILKIVIFVFLFFIFSSTKVKAANLYFQSSSSSHQYINDSFSVNVYVSSTNQAINAVSGVISFPQDKLEIISISKDNSIFNLWVQEPSFSNSLGTARFEGIILNPGFVGNKGKIINIVFKVKAAGGASISFSSGAILANDGKGTNILSNIGSILFSLGDNTITMPEAECSTEDKKEKTPAADDKKVEDKEKNNIVKKINSKQIPKAPQIISNTHPDSDKWYAIKDAEFTWSAPSDIVATRLLVGKLPNAFPNVNYKRAISYKKITDLEDGVWYFHVRLKNSSGWGDVAHFKFQIDTQKPNKFNIERIKQDDFTNPRASFVFTAEDELSGIDYYEIQIDNHDATTWQNNKDHIFTTTPLVPGKHILKAKAVDKAGNFVDISREFVIKEIKKPVIIEYSKEITSGDNLIIRGTTYPQSSVVVWIQKEKGRARKYVVKSDLNGSFKFVLKDKLRSGVYKIWSEVIDKNGAKSKPTKKMTIIVKRLSILKISNFIIKIFNIIVPLIALFILLFVLVLYAWRKFISFKDQIFHDKKNIEKEIHKTFLTLRRGIKKEIVKLSSQKTLNKKEKEVYDNIVKNLKNFEKDIVEMFKKHKK